MRKHSWKTKSSVSRAANFHARKCHFYRVSEIYAWCGQTPCVMSVAAVRQRASHVPLGLPDVVCG
ncbi:hypothetical protein CWM52_18625 [Raoultella sp. T31]|nr:hypothetical protein CWM52_18625 [Raoultella sp. T31]